MKRDWTPTCPPKKYCPRMKTRQNIPCYVSGRPYKPLLAGDCRHDQVINLAGASVEWSRLRQIVSRQLRGHGYAESSISLYRTVLQNFYRAAKRSPGQVNSNTVRSYIEDLAAPLLTLDRSFQRAADKIGVHVLEV